MISRSDDSEFQLVQLDGVHGSSTDDYFTVKRADGWDFCPRNPNHLPLPVPGDMARFYGRGIGYQVRGFAAAGRVYFYETAAEFGQRLQANAARDKRARAEKFEANLEQWDRDVTALPEPFRRRIGRFMRKTEWGPEFGPYELFVCQEAAAIAAAVSLPNLKVFHGAKPERQKEMVPALRLNEHSGSTFGAACVLAQIYLERPVDVPRWHGALCPLVGCREYGCFAATGDNNTQ